MSGVIIYQADAQDHAPSPLLTARDPSQVTTVCSPPSLLRAWLRHQKIFFTPRSRHRSCTYHLLAKVLGLHYGRTAEVKELLHADPKPGCLMLIAGDYSGADIYPMYLHGLHRPVQVFCLSRGRRRLPYITWIWCLARLRLLRVRHTPT